MSWAFTADGAVRLPFSRFTPLAAQSSDESSSSDSCLSANSRSDLRLLIACISVVGNVLSASFNVITLPSGISVTVFSTLTSFVSFALAHAVNDIAHATLTISVDNVLFISFFVFVLLICYLPSFIICHSRGVKSAVDACHCGSGIYHQRLEKYF